MRYRELGRTGLTVSEIGYGAWGLGQGAWVGADDESGVRALHRALDLGVTFIDTARGYDRSERVVGRALKELPGGGEGVHVATKVGPKVPVSLSPSGLDPMEAFPGAHLRESLETSLRELGRDHVDLLQLHTWEDEWTGRGDWLETVDALKREGKIRFFGISVKDHQPENVLTVLRTGVLDTVQVIYNVFEQAPSDALLPACEEYGVGVIVRVALDEGALTGAIRTGVTFPKATGATGTSGTTGPPRSSSMSTRSSPTWAAPPRNSRPPPCGSLSQGRGSPRSSSECVPCGTWNATRRSPTPHR